MSAVPIDGSASQVALGVLSNAIYDFGRRIFDRVGPAGPNQIASEKESAIDQAIDLAVEKLTEVEVIRDDMGGEALREFLRSPEVIQFGRQVFAARLNMGSFTPDHENPEVLADPENVKVSFIRSLQLWTGINDAAAEEHGGRLYSAFVDACDEGLNILVRRNLLAAHDALSAMNTERVLAEINNLSRNLELQEQAELDVPAILDFEKRYRGQVADRDTQISLPSLNERISFHVGKVYVKPTLRTVAAAQSKVAYDELLPLVDGTVVLGDPGGGKSTLISKLIDDICTSGRAESGTPIPVVLRDYAAEKATSGCSLLEFMETRARGRYQLSSVPVGAFEYLLRNRRAVVLFDGLDELLETSARREIAGDVESFRRLFPTTPVIITSRKVGYEEAPLRSNRFTALELAELEEHQVEEYTERALELRSGVSEKKRLALRAEFMEKSSTLTDLRSNPLLLGLLLERYTKTQNLPANRVAVIEACALLLFERWDSDRAIFVKFPFESKLKPVVSHLANEIYNDLKLQQGATERWLVKATINYLVGRKYDDPVSASEEAQEFIELCSGRTWVFSATGMNAEAEELFQFTHRTFMEYFVAAFLCRTKPEPEELLAFLLPRVKAQEWDEVCQLAVHMLARDRELGADLVLASLLPDSGEAADEGLNQVVFCTRALASLVPDRLETVADFLERWLVAVENATMRPSQSGRREPLIKLLDSLVNANSENQVTLARRLPHIFAENEPGRHAPVRRTWLAEVGCNLPHLLRFHADDEEYDVWARASAEIAAERLPTLGAGAGEDLALDCSAVWHGSISLDQFIEQWGVGGLLVDRQLEAMAGDPQRREVLPSLAEALIRAAAHPGSVPSRARERQWALGQLSNLGERFRDAIPVHGRPETRWEPPVTSGARRPRNYERWLIPSMSGGSVSEWSAGQLFAASCLLLALDEQCESNLATSPGFQTTPGLMGVIAPLLAGREQRDHDYPPCPLLEMLDTRHEAELCRWAEGDFSFTR